MNITNTKFVPNPKLAGLFHALGNPNRLKILLVLGSGEACVCHLKAVLGLRQAHLSQHLMALRQAGLVSDSRQGRFIYYRLSDPAIMEIIRSACKMAGIDISDPRRLEIPTVAECPCPRCHHDESLCKPAC